MLKVLVGNKCDKEREIPLRIAEQYAHNNGFDFFMETSALQADNVENLFYKIAEILVERRQQRNGSGYAESYSERGSFPAATQNQSSSNQCLSMCNTR